VLDLYLRHARPRLISEYGDLVAHYARELAHDMLLRGRGRAEQAEEEGKGEGAEATEGKTGQ
jgi:hypothetical protein